MHDRRLSTRRFTVTTPLPSPLTVALKGRCPRCGRGAAVCRVPGAGAALRELRPRLSFIDTADGPAFFVISIVGIVVVALALFVEFRYRRRAHIVLLVAR